MSVAEEGKVLIVDDDLDMCQMLCYLMQTHGYQTTTVHDGYAALKKIKTVWPDVMLVDVQMPEMTGIELLKQVLQQRPALPVIMITGHAGVADAVEVMRAGAVDYISKPFNHEHVMRVIRCALEQRKQATVKASSAIEVEAQLHQQMGPSEAIAHIAADVRRVAQTSFTVVLQGETGTGKSLLARTIHDASPRAKKNFVALDCGAIPESLLESELFGYERGAFTGANCRKAGQFELVQGGTLFLDEVANMSLSSQMKLLCALQDKVIFPLGGAKAIPVDVRLLAASNQDLRAAVANGEFREDLYYRLNEFAINLPALRERSEDILFLADRFRQASNQELKKSINGFSKEAQCQLQTYDWPGNVRQLRTVVRRAVLLAEEMITAQHIQLDPPKDNDIIQVLDKVPYQGLSLKEIVKKNTAFVEQQVLTEVLAFTNGNKAEAARLLQVDYKTIHTKLKRYGIA
ncbi:sigma-54-dependent transcriptional regulator [Spartinivicinus ruber]|uniref:sigma-54-dependent transcriptional regulator n=1 Tax=Spartinivicinus ruber TaxID=2683272 RepID=UPI001CA3C202|nr:sigma-54 dependent transcriptional regulator [Spartinivicinus ruber]